MKSTEVTRRGFLLGAGAVLAGRAVAAGKKKAPAAKAEAKPAAKKATAKTPSVGGGKALRLAWIGVGTRGSSTLQSALAMPGAQVVAVADTYAVYRDRALAWCKPHFSGVKGYGHFEDLLEKEKLDGVVIATPDHIHEPAALAAMAAGVHVYSEKPITLTLDAAKAMRDTAKAKGIVFQTGTQLRSMPMYQKAREVAQSGALGQLMLLQVNRHFQGKMVEAKDLPPEANEQTVDWPAFLRDTQAYPWTPARYFRWRNYLEYSNGYFGDLMLHHLDMGHFVTGAGMPSKVLATGGIYHYNDGRTCPDTVSALLEYPEKFHVNFTCTAGNDHYGIVERYLFTEGTIEITDMGRMSIFRKAFKEDVGSDGIKNEPHLQDFFDAIRSGGTTIAPVEAGFQGAVCAHMAMRSCLEGKAMLWDPAKEEVALS